VAVSSSGSTPRIQMGPFDFLFQDLILLHIISLLSLLSPSRSAWPSALVHGHPILLGDPRPRDIVCHTKSVVLRQFYIASSAQSGVRLPAFDIVSVDDEFLFI
jgi:hypothetical protein